MPSLGALCFNRRYPLTLQSLFYGLSFEILHRGDAYDFSEVTLVKHAFDDVGADPFLLVPFLLVSVDHVAHLDAIATALRLVTLCLIQVLVIELLAEGAFWRRG